MSEYYLIQNPNNENEFFHPHPNGVYGQYVYKFGYVGAAGFVKNDADIIAAQQNPPANVIPMDAPQGQPIKVVKKGRNDPCDCGSGKKYKKCCGKN